MWPFRGRPASPDLIERIETLERASRSLRLEWEDTLEKLTRIIGRLSKRAALERQRALAATAEGETAEDAPGSPIGGPDGGGHELDPFSQRVKALRRHG